MIYTIITSKEADEDISCLKKSEINAYNKVMHLFEELQEHPRTGTGKPKPLKHRPDIWSRRITKKHRLTYSIRDEEVRVLVLSARTHYNDR